MTVPRAIALALLLALAAALPATAGARADTRVRVTIPADNTGTGNVTGPGIDCPGACTEFFPEGSQVTLEGNPGDGSELTWGAVCEGTPGTSPCTFTATGTITRVSAVFTRTGPGGGNDTKAPETTITKAPKKKIKTRKGKARVAFEFAASEKGSSFDCRLDKKPFVECASPLKLRVGPGKHTFEVRATDEADNADESPARASFKVKRKKRK